MSLAKQGKMSVDADSSQLMMGRFGARLALHCAEPSRKKLFGDGGRRQPKTALANGRDFAAPSTAC